MFTRDLAEEIKKTIKTFSVLVLTGPRQSGKTTLLKHLFPNHQYITLESPDQLLQVKSDPRSIIESFENGIIFDEAQNYPDLFSYIQEYVDKKRSPGRFILSGSQNFLLAESVSQSLAGRAAILELLPLTYKEFSTQSISKDKSVWWYLFHGSYPGPYQEKHDIKLWYSSYIRTYLERDVRHMLAVSDLSKFQLFLKLCAGFHGQILNLSNVAQACSISQPTASRWISILESSYILLKLPPYYRNFKKRLVKTPKLYFYDSGLVCHLLGIESPSHLKTHSSRGPIFEGFILTDLIKHNRSAQGFYFWQDHRGLEIDIVHELGSQLNIYEVKSGQTFNESFLDNLKKWQQLSTCDQSLNLVYSGKKSFSVNDISIRPWNTI
ncbi:MAG: ATP-binding protein [Candidatus Margulisbacteria bacterium]|nr:ATP-binding protein [Candidatus Margulisiibacteriota bacterium]